jgi:tripartite-type tricarboxylate transporter receptor subunit TctC
MIVWRRLVIAAVACGICGVSLAQAADPVKDFPLRPLRIIAPFPPGGTSDIMARLLAPRLADRLGQNIIVENRPGAGSVIGTAYVARATADGHTMLLMSGAFPSVAAVSKSLPYEPLKDFDWITMVVTYPFVVLVNANSTIRAVDALIAEAKRRPGKILYGSVGVGSVVHLTAELFSSMTGTEMLHVPYKGGGDLVTALTGGHVDIVFGPLSGWISHINAKRVRPVAVASLERSAQLPGVPTVAETVPGFEVMSSAGISVPRGTPRPVIARLNRELRDVVLLPEIRKFLVEQGGEALPTSPEEMGRHIADEISKWQRTVKAAKIQVQ